MVIIIMQGKVAIYSLYKLNAILSFLQWTVIFVFIITLIIFVIIFYFSKIFNWERLTGISVFSFLKKFLLVSLSISEVVIALMVLFNISYISIISRWHIYNLDEVTNLNNIKFFNHSFYLTIDLFGLILCFLAFAVALLSFLALDTRLYWKNIKFLISCNLLSFFVFLYTSVSDILLLFFFYECLLIPSFTFVYFVSPYRRAIQASLYFLIWTQVGSLFVLLATAYIFYVVGNSNFSDIRAFNFTINEIKCLFMLLFFGFGVKIPMWPFHHWLTKTHVEAPAGFSMFLSGFLVKSAVYGFYKLSNLLGGEISTIFISVFLIIGVIDASIKMWGQTDLKKLIAYSTVQEMNLIYLAFCWGDTLAIWGGLLFCITHAFLSSLLFYTVDCVQRRFHTRSVIELSGLLTITPNLGTVIFFNSIFYSGLPGTLKFLSEIYIYSGLAELTPLSLIILMVGCNFLGLIGFCKCWFNVLFGMTAKLHGNIPLDLTVKELFIILICYVNLILLTSIDNLLLS